jgi:hypothetical protein
MGGTLRISNFKILSMKCIKFLAVEGAELASTQKFSTTAKATATATVRDRRKICYRSNHVIYS